jgi:hypothetical protein
MIGLAATIVRNLLASPADSSRHNVIIPEERFGALVSCDAERSAGAGPRAPLRVAANR